MKRVEVVVHQPEVGDMYSFKLRSDFFDKLSELSNLGFTALGKISKLSGRDESLSVEITGVKNTEPQINTPHINRLW